MQVVRGLFVAALFLTSFTAEAQEDVSPNAVYACTGINDPRQLHECILRNSGYQPQPLPGLPTGDPSAIKEDKGTGDVNAAGPPP